MNQIPNSKHKADYLVKIAQEVKSEIRNAKSETNSNTEIQNDRVLQNSKNCHSGSALCFGRLSNQRTKESPNSIKMGRLLRLRNLWVFARVNSESIAVPFQSSSNNVLKISIFEFRICLDSGSKKAIFTK